MKFILILPSPDPKIATLIEKHVKAMQEYYAEIQERRLKLFYGQMKTFESN